VVKVTHDSYAQGDKTEASLYVHRAPAQTLQNNATVDKIASDLLKLRNCRQNQPPNAAYA